MRLKTSDNTRFASNLKMAGNHIEIWNKCLSVIQDNIEAQSFETWFKPIVPLALVDNLLTIQVPSQFVYEWLETHYIELLKKTIKRVIGPDGKLDYSIIMDSGDSTSTMKLPSSNRTDPKNQLGRPTPEKLSDGPMNPFVIPGLKKLVIDPQLNENYTFDNFIEGECNRVARQGGLAIAKNPGKTAYNPLLIYSNTGLGKTHLCHAIGLETKRLHPETTVLYVQAEQFTNQYITASKNKNLNDFVHFYQMIDVLIIDDIQFLAKNPTHHLPNQSCIHQLYFRSSSAFVSKVMTIFLHI